MGMTGSVGTAMANMESILSHVISLPGETFPANPGRVSFRLCQSSQVLLGTRAVSYCNIIQRLGLIAVFLSMIF